MKTFLSVSLLVLCIWDEVYSEPQPLSIGEFFQNIPDQIGSAWGKLLDVIREPIKARRLGSIGKRKTIKPYKMPNQNTTAKPFEVISIMSSSERQKSSQPDPHKDDELKLAIPFVKFHQTGNELIPNSAKKKKLDKYLDGQKPYFMKSTSTTESSTEKTTLSLKSKVRIPVLLEPTYQSVNDWNNNQRPHFAEIHKITKGTTAFAHILKYMYGGTIPIYYKPTPLREITFNPERKEKTKEVVILI